MKRKLNYKKKKHTVSSQTIICVDTPHSIHEDLPSIFGSTVCFKAKPLFVSKSLLALACVNFIHVTEDDLLLEAAEEAVFSMRGKLNTVMKLQEKEQRI